MSSSLKKPEPITRPEELRQKILPLSPKTEDPASDA